MTARICTVDSCDQPHAARGLCHPHYRTAHHRGALPPLLGPTTPHATVTNVARDYGITVVDIIGPNTDAPTVAARRAATHRLRDLDLSWREIAKILGDRDHKGIANLARRPAADPPTDPHPLPAGCHVPSCERDPKHQSMAFCGAHDRRWRRTGNVDPDRPLRPVLVDGPVLDLEVHDRTGYRDGCRCDVCRADAVRSVKRNRHQPMSRPPERGAAAIRPLLDAGMTVADVARAAGVNRQTLDRWLHGKGRARQPTIDRVLAVPVPETTCVDCGGIPLGGGLRCGPCFHEWALARRSA